MKNIFFFLLIFVGFYVNSQCPAPEASEASGCSGESKPISARSFLSAGVTLHRWYTTPTGNTQVSGVAQNTAPSTGLYISTLTKSHTTTTTYYVASVCGFSESTTRTPITFTVNNSANIQIQVVGGPRPSYCTGETVSLRASGGGSYQWRKNSSTSIVLSTNTNFSVTSSGRYFLTGTNSCGQRQTKSIDINFTLPETPEESRISVAENCGSTTITLNPPAGEIWYWQTTEDGTNISNSETSRTFTSVTPLYIRSRLDSTDCWSPARAVTYAVNASPSVPTSVNGDSRCGSGSVTVSAAPGSGGNTIRWYTTLSGNTLLGTGLSLNRTISQTTTYYAATYNNTTQCISSSRVVVQASVGAPVPPQEVSNSGCSGETNPISASSTSTNVTEHRWYNNPSGGNPISGIAQNTEPASGNYISTLTKTFTQTETYYVAAVCNGAESITRTPVTFTVGDSTPLAMQNTPSLPQYCSDDNLVLTALNGNAGSYEWRLNSPQSAVLSTASTFSPTVSGTYYLTGTIGCGNEQTIAREIVFASLTTPTIEDISEDCGTTTITRNNPPESEVWHWQATADGTDTSPASTEETRIFSTTQPLFLRSRAEFTDCWGPAIAVDFQVKAVPPAPEIHPLTQTVRCSTQPYDLSVINSDTATMHWYDSPTGGNSIYEGNVYRVNNVIVGTTSYYVESVNNTTNCASLTRTEIQVTVHDGDGVSTPFGQGVQFCSEQAVTLSVNLPSGADEVQWYDSQFDGTLLATGTQYTTQVINETTLYYVVGVNLSTGCQSGPRVIQAVRTEAIVWYLDEDQDGLGDPANPSALLCDQPEGYVSNDNDLCPEIHSTTNNCSSDPLDQNYVYTRAYQTKSSVTIDSAFFTENDAFIQSIAYFDGLGRPAQQVAINQSPNRQDIVSFTEYDGFGRVAKEWLPFPATDNAFATYRLNPKTKTFAFYNTQKFEDTQNPYSEKAFEASPLNRTLQQATPGNDWALGSGHEIELAYQTNTNDDDIVQLEVSTTFANNTYQAQLQDHGYYNQGELYKNVTYDENNTGGKNHSTEEFTNKLGQVVLKRTYADIDFNQDGDTNDDNETDVAHDTYYVYDDFGNLTYVLPPKVDVTDGVSPEELKELCYQYTYDHRNRLVIKQIPGKGEEYIVYNRLNQPIMTQDPNLRLKKQWLFTKYDAFGRVAYTGILTNTTTKDRVTVQNEVNAFNSDLWVTRGSYSNGGINIGYTNTAYPSSGTIEVLTVNYYDDYSFDRGNEPTVPANIFGEAIDPRVKGVPTGSRVRVLETDDWITSITRYNYQGRAIYSYSENEYLNTTDLVTTKIDFVGRPLTVRAAHSRNGNTVTTLDNFTYDHVGRLLTQTQCIGDENLGDTCPNGGSTVNAVAHLEIANQTVSTNQVARERITIIPQTSISGIVTLSIDPNATSSGGEQELIVDNTYDEIGQLINKKVGGATTANGLQSVDYEYNVRGWLQGINNSTPYDNALTVNGEDLWGFRIKYNDIADGSKKLFNGNISETLWDSKSDEPGNNPISKRYTYDYDPLNRITAATDNTDKFNLSNISYDKNGNIETLKREGWTSASPSLSQNTGFGTMDNLVYTYDSGNKLTNVADNNASDTYGFKDVNGSGTEYVYDANGNMISDANKGITGIEYNHLNLPEQVTFTSGNIQYVYDATGKKIQKTFNGTVIDYANGYMYEDNQLQFFGHPQGYIMADGNSFRYVYDYKDHLGNVRLSYADANGDGDITQNEIIEESNYYPFGLKHKGYNNNINSLGSSLAQKWKHNGKELNEELGLNWYDYGWRNYDPAISRWMNIDNKSEDYIEWSPYNYTLNNPIYFIDPDGNGVNDVWSYNTDTNKLDWISDEGGDEVQTVIVTNNEGKHFGTRSIESSEVFVMETSNSVLISGYDHQIPDGYNSNTGHEYTADDLKTRRKLIEGGYSDYVSGLENSGNSGELSQQHFHENYVKRTPNNTDSAFWFAIEEGYFAPPGGGSAGKLARNGASKLRMQGNKLSGKLAKSKQSFKTNVGTTAKSKGSLSGTSSSSVTRATSGNSASSRSASQIKNSWNKFLSENKGKYKGKDWVKKAAVDYKKIQSAN